MLKQAAPLLALVLSLATAGCDGPFVLVPGGALDGPAAPTPDSWAFTDDIGTVQLESNPADPYSVNIWVAAVDESLYVHAGANRSKWVEHMEADPRVRMRLGDSIYDLVAARVEGQDEFDRFSDAYEEKYDTRPRNEDITEVYLFRLTPRQPPLGPGPGRPASGR